MTIDLNTQSATRIGRNLGNWLVSAFRSIGGAFGGQPERQRPASRGSPLPGSPHLRQDLGVPEIIEPAMLWGYHGK